MTIKNAKLCFIPLAKNRYRDLRVTRRLSYLGNHFFFTSKISCSRICLVTATKGKVMLANYKPFFQICLDILRRVQYTFFLVFFIFVLHDSASLVPIIIIFSCFSQSQSQSGSQNLLIQIFAYTLSMASHLVIISSGVARSTCLNLI